MTAAATPAPARRHGLYYRFNRFLERVLPEGLYQRSLIIVIAPIVLLQTVMVGVILDRHWDNVTKVLGRSLAREIGLIVDLYDQSAKTEAALNDIERTINNRIRIGFEILRGAELPPLGRRPLFSLVDSKMTKYLARETGRPFWIDSQRTDGLVDIRVQAADRLVFRFLTDEDRVRASGTDALLFWMLFSSLIILAIAVVFLRKQIRPIVELAHAAQSFGMGRDVGGYEPRGAAEVRLAGQAFLDMKERIERHVDQRTTMLAGVSHDLRTILTRFKLELAFLGDDPRTRPLQEDVDEMEHMLEAYLAFVRGDGGEVSQDTDISALVKSVVAQADAGRGRTAVHLPDGLKARVKPNAMRRLIANIVGNAIRYAGRAEIAADITGNALRITVDDNGPGIPPAQRTDAFRPFVRLDNARNLDETGTGLGLAIALDIAHAHGGDLRLEESPLGGLRAVAVLPV